MITVGILGATGSIGRQTVEIIRQYPQFRCAFFSLHRSIDKLPSLIEELNPQFAVVTDHEAFKRITPQRVPVYGPEDLAKILDESDADILLNAMVGNAGLYPSWKWLSRGKKLALANKESLVSGGLLMKKLLDQGGEILPVDSEHSAIWQCLQGSDKKEVEKIILTASGGAFRDYSKEEIAGMKASQALKHPNWSMGAKITIDSATLINKGLEVMEAYWLFDLPLEQIEVVIHRESIIHSMVAFRDSAVLAQMGQPDMRLPILYALAEKKRPQNDWQRLDFSKAMSLHFEPVEEERFPGFALAKVALKKGGNMPLVFNTVNELCVAAYLKDAIGFYDISDQISRAMAQISFQENPEIEDLLALDAEIRRKFEEML